MKELYWTNLVTSLRYGQCVLVLGPEVPTKFASAAETTTAAQDRSYTEALTCRLASELEGDNRRVTGETLVAVAQQFEDAEVFGPDILRSLAAQFYTSAAYQPSDVHYRIASLPVSLIITMCHDDLLTCTLQKSGKKPLVCRYNIRGDKHDNPEFPPSETPDEPVVYHLFGDAQEPRSLVLSENDVLDFLIAVVSQRPPLPSSLIRVLKRMGQSFLFVGFGIKQWYLRVLLKLLIRAFELRTGSAVAAEPLRGLSEIDRKQIILFYQRGTRGGMRVEVEDAEVGTFLSELMRRLEAAGGVVAPAPSLGPRLLRVFICYAREDSELAERVYHTLQKSNFGPWLDRESLEGGDLWDQRIRDQLEDADFVLVLYTPTLSRKTDSYVNKEIALARERAREVRGNFLIPLGTAELTPQDRIRELHEYQEMVLRLEYFDEDMAKVISTMRRESQRRNR